MPDSSDDAASFPQMTEISSKRNSSRRASMKNMSHCRCRSSTVRTVSLIKLSSASGITFPGIHAVRLPISGATAESTNGMVSLRRQKTGTPCAMQPPIMSSPSLRISEWEVCDVKSFENQISGYVRRHRRVPNGTHECRRFFYAGRLVRKRQTRAESLSVTIRNGRRILLR